MADNSESLNLIITETGADQTAAKLNKVDAAAQKVVKSTKAQEAAYKSEQKALSTNIKLLDQYAAKKKASAAQLADERFSRVSQDVGIIGDIESSLRATGASGLLPDLLGAAEALPRLKVGLEGLPAQAKAAAEALGAGGAGLVAGILAVIAVTKIAEAANEQYAASVRSVLAGQEEYFRLIQTGTTESVKAEIERKKTELAVQQDIIAQNKFYLDELQRQIGGAGAALSDVFNLGGVQETRKATQDAEAEAAKLATQIGNLEKALNTGQVAANDAAEAEAKLAEERRIATEQSIKYIVDQKRFEADANRLSVAQIQEKQQAIQDEIKLIEFEIAARNANGQATDDLITKWAALGQQEVYLTSTALGLAQAREAEAAAAEYQKQQIEELAAATENLNNDLAKINDQDAASRDKLREALLSIVEEAEKAAQDALNSLIEARNEIARDAGREEDAAARSAATERINIQIDSYRQELDIYKNYKRQLRDIERKAQDDSFDLILNRDFSGLFNLNRGTEIAKRDAGQAERDAIEDAREGRQRQFEDLQRSLEAERQERLIAFQQRIADATAAYQQEQLQIAAQRKDAEAKAQAARIKEKAALDQQYASRVQAAQNELALINQTEQQRVAIMAAAQNALLQQARQLLAAVSGGAGGAASAGASSGSVQFSQTNNINGSNMESVGNLIDTRTRKLIQGYFT